MSDLKISQLEDGGSSQAADAIPIARSGQNYYVTSQYLKNFVFGSNGTVSIAAGKTFSVNNTITLNGNDGVSVNFGSGGTFLYSGGALGTPSSGTMTNVIGLPLTSGVTGTLPVTNGGTGITSFGTGVATALGQNVTGSGGIVLATSPTLTTPMLGVASATSINKITLSQPASGATLTLANGSTLATSGAYSITLTATGTSNVTLPASGTLASSTSKLSDFASTTSAELRSVISDETGTDSLVFANTPTLVTPILGTPTSGTLTNCTGLPVSTGISGLGTNVAAFLATPSSANLRAALTDETGTGAAVFADSPTFVDDITLGTQGTTQGAIILANAAVGSYPTTIKSSNSATAAYTLTLPTTAGTNGYFLQTDGVGNLTWAASGGGGGGGSVAGSNTQVQFNDAGSFGAAAAFTYDKAAYALTLGVSGASTGALKLAHGTSSYSTTISSGNNSAAWTLTLPTSAGTNGYILTTNGSGTTSWANPTALGIDLDVGATAITGGTTGRVLYDNGGLLGEYSAVPVGSGGTGTTTAQGAMNAFAGAVTSGSYLRGNGTNVIMSAIQAADVPTLNQNTTGTAANVTGTVAVANGGTGLTSLTAGRIPYGAGTSAFGNSSGLTFGVSTWGTAANSVFQITGTNASYPGRGSALTLASQDGLSNVSVANDTGSQALQFYIGTSEKMRITSTGTVNIVGAGTAGSTQAVSLNGSAPINSMVLDSSGNVGIGTSSPTNKLSIQQSVNNTFAGMGLGIFRQGDDSELALGYRSDIASGAFVIGPSYNSTGSYLPLVFRTSDTIRMLLDTSGNVTLNSATFSPASPSTAGNLALTGTVAMGSSFKRNRIINGNMQVWQRSTAPAAGALASFTYNSVDRWAFYSNTTSATISQNTSVPTGFLYSLKFQRTASSTGTSAFLAQQIIETVNCLDLAGQTATLSFYAKAGANFSASGNILTANVYTGTVADQGGNSGAWTGVAAPLSASQAITTTWTRYSFPVTIASNVLEIAVLFGFTPVGTAGADDSVYITGVQLEVGSVATPYERQIYSEQLAQCQRYYWKYLTLSGAYATYSSAVAYSTTQSFLAMQYPTTMRAAPTISYSGSIALYNGTFYNITSFGTIYYGNNTAGINGNVAAGLVAGSAYAFLSNNDTNAYIQGSAEL